MTTDTAPRIAVVGLGAMGLPMASRLRTAFQVTGADLDPTRRELAESLGIPTATDPREAVSGSDAVLLMVRTPEQLHDALASSTGFGAVLRRGATVIVSSTVGIHAMRAAETTLGDIGVHLVDAPVSGGPVRAGKGELLIVVGAAEPARTAAAPMLSHLASSLVVIGDRAGDGQAFKTVNQLLCGVHIAAAAEALALAQRLGLDPAATLSALQGGAAASFMLSDRGPRVVRGLSAADSDAADVEVASRLDIFVKDMGLVTAAATEHRLPVPVAAAAHQLFLTGLAEGLGAADDSQIVGLIS